MAHRPAGDPAAGDKVLAAEGLAAQEEGLAEVDDLVAVLAVAGPEAAEAELVADARVEEQWVVADARMLAQSST
jgi:hypothetical protein